MRAKFSCNCIDRKGNYYFSNQEMKDIDISSKGEEHFGGFWFTKDGTNKSIRPDGSLAIYWQIEYFDNLCDLKVLHCAENDCQKVI